jgi:hypothetical protein
VLRAKQPNWPAADRTKIGPGPRLTREEGALRGVEERAGGAGGGTSAPARACRDGLARLISATPTTIRRRLRRSGQSRKDMPSNALAPKLPAEPAWRCSAKRKSDGSTHMPPGGDRRTAVRFLTEAADVTHRQQ